MITQYPLPRPVPSGVVDIHEQIQRASNCDCTPTRVDDARAAKSGRGDDGVGARAPVAPRSGGFGASGGGRVLTQRRRRYRAGVPNFAFAIARRKLSHVAK